MKQGRTITVVLTRALEDSRKTANLFRKKGFKPLIFPTVAFSLPENLESNIHTLKNISNYDYILFTSPNAVRMTLKTASYGMMDFPKTPINTICIGGKTAAEAMKNENLNIVFTGEKALGAELPGEIHKAGIARGKILIPKSNLASDDLGKALANMGFEVEDKIFYTTETPAKPEPGTLEELERGVQLITFFSPSAVKGFSALVPERLLERLKLEAETAVIGPVTRKAALKAGFRVTIEPKNTSSEGLAEAILSETSKIIEQ